MIGASLMRFGGIAAFCAIFAGPLAAQGTQSGPQGPVVLTVSGDAGLISDDMVAVFDLDMLQNMRAVSFSTSTDWTEGVSEFTGVPLYEVLTGLGVTQGQITARAINDYAVTIEFDEIGEDYPIIAYARDGDVMSVREKGPLWIVFPYDLDGIYRTEQVFAQSIWQLDRLEVVR